MKIRHSRVYVGLICLLALTACDLYPDAGKWGGTLAVHDAAWSESYSCAVDVDITHTEDLVSLNSVDSYCGSRSLHWSPGVLRRRGDGLWNGNDERVGDVYPDGTVRIELHDPSFSDHYPARADRVVVTWTRMGDQLQFSLREDYEGSSRTMEGALNRIE